ncbi:hypothetical protein Leucomu_05795 [Leucobacter muris]|uniref:XRE family transcriptional regulator n=1 Tax=Leucobacter muris TaxID=1935379 RepID=A0ABX5QEI6_9MICO|nr:hypothetical protein [Leucobacter muris]QAB17498.1 hypothetical protein Leucomu_05795 [Leucobacter muris]
MDNLILDLLGESSVDRSSIELAAKNHRSQRHLIEGLANALKVAGVSISSVAEKMGESEYLVCQWLDGDRDLTLSQLRKFANSIDAFVDYRVTSLSESADRKFKTMTSSHASNNWVEWEPGPDHRPAEMIGGLG